MLRSHPYPVTGIALALNTTNKINNDIYRLKPYCNQLYEALQTITAEVHAIAPEMRHLRDWRFMNPVPFPIVSGLF